MRHAFPAFAVLLMVAGCDAEPAKFEQDDTVKKAEPEPKATSTPVSKPADKDNPCERLTFEDVLLTHCIADPEQHRIVTLLGPKGGPPYRGLGRLAEDRAEKGPKVVFALNGGMFNEDGQPIGYYVENGERLKKINTNKGPGNFHMLPNGVFFGTQGNWDVRTAEDFVETVSERPAFGTQSGPMLVIEGKLHPGFADDGESRHIRNAVGVDEDGKAHFVISEMPISFGKLARYFRDELETQNALYLDGNVSALWNPATARIDARGPIGPLIVVEKRSKAQAKPSDEETVKSGESADSKKTTDIDQ